MGTVVLMCPDVNRRRVDRLRPNTPPPRRICRRLFQDGSPQSRIATLSALQQEGEKQSITKWNFDFRAGVPLPGRFKWVPVHHPVKDSKPPAVTEQSPHPKKQSKITDFMKKRKLTDSTTDHLSSKSRRKLDCGLT